MRESPKSGLRIDQGSVHPWASWRLSRTMERPSTDAPKAEGGRGHDYRVVDPGIDDRGGLLLILTWVPWSEREWIQFLGRTGRQDHAGQFAVFLNSQDLRSCAGRQFMGALHRVDRVGRTRPKSEDVVACQSGRLRGFGFGRELEARAPATRHSLGPQPEGVDTWSHHRDTAYRR